jgi:putative tryptophan/tyrosine transport system substrate-binding protein
VRRREFIAGLGSAAAWSVVAHAQHDDRMRRVGVLMAYGEDDPEAKAYLAAFRRGLQEMGWAENRNLRMDVRWTAGNLERMQTLARELVGLQPDAILSDTTPVTAAVQREARTIPIVFTTVSDPIGSGFVASLPRPGRNITGFSNHDSSMAGKWLEFLTQIAPTIKRCAIMFNPDMSPYVMSYYLPFLEAGARLLKVEPVIAPVRTDADIEIVINSLAGNLTGGLIVMPDTFVSSRRAAIISLAASNRVPAVFNGSVFVRDGGLLSYGMDTADAFHRAAAYIDRILRGDKPEAMPVQLPVKFQIAVNTRTAKALGVTLPASIQLLADEVIE